MTWSRQMKVGRSFIAFLIPGVCFAQEGAPSPPVRRLATGMTFTEGPVWIPAEDCLIFSDIPQSRLMRWSEAGGLTVERPADHPNGNLLDLDGRLLTCQHGARNIVRWRVEGGQEALVTQFEEHRFNSPNDLAIQSDGTLWFTDPPWGLPRQREGKELPGHFVFRRDPDGAIHCVLRDRAMPNGIALSPDETRLYVADTGGHPSHPDPATHEMPATVSAYTIGEGRELSPEPLWQIDTRCDGMCIDVDGKLYLTGSKGVTIWSPEGEPAGEIAVPETPANVCFGGADYTTLFITARTSLYSVELKIAGAKPRGARW